MTPRHVWRDPSLRPVVAASLTLSLAIGVFGVSFGVGAVSAGASVAQACVMSLLVFTGASQLSAVSVIAAGGTTASALGGALVLAARNGVYALTMGRRVRGRLPTRLVAAQLTIDESTAMSLAQDDPVAQRAAFWITGGSVYVFWNLATFAGALIGTAIDPVTFGLDAAFPAAYVAMVWPQLRTARGRDAALLGSVICLGLVPVLPVGVPILCAALAVLVGVPAPSAPSVPSARPAEPA
ncbi:MAG: AzlC family ABC transporter permease [Ilumatobacteraceae bacterium]|nr:AzlC family ABC transporter permease [Acidimicrobiales bacterium]MCB9393094.1 AzlC family ABC transporter permease [Acidimicrobiaceae bacterium]